MMSWAKFVAKKNPQANKIQHGGGVWSRLWLQFTTVSLVGNRKEGIKIEQHLFLVPL
jgi:hypothetical protein